MRDINALHQEVTVLERKYGQGNIVCDKGYNWLLINNFRLPPGLNKDHSRFVILLPEHYGNGAPLIDSFLEPGLQWFDRNSRKWKDLDHYFKHYNHSEALLSFGTRKFWSNRGYWWLCLQDVELGQESCSHLPSIRQYLNHVFIFFSNPVLNLNKVFKDYQQAAG